MRYLLDTVAVLMWWTDPARLGAAARELVATGEAAVHLSAVSIWEIANKNRIGKLPQIVDFAGDLPALVARDRFVALDLRSDHALRAGYLPGAHRDPFDRLLAGQALVEDMTILTNDPELARFGCKVIW